MKNILLYIKALFPIRGSKLDISAVTKENAAERRRTARLPLAWKPRHRGDLIRLGAEYDGGYVVTETAVRSAAVLVGLGVEHNWTFEEEFHRMTGCAVHCYDHTIGFHEFLKPAYIHAKAWTEGLEPLDMPKITLPFKYRIFFSGRKKHYAEKVGTGPGSSDFRKIFSRTPGDKPVFIKMDIEGWEYSVLSGLTDYHSRITGLVIEFHHVISFPEVMDYCIRELKQEFDIVHIHVNNHSVIDKNSTPMTIEITFENRSLRKGPDAESSLGYPVEGLDSPNNPALPDFVLEFY